MTPGIEIVVRGPFAALRADSPVASSVSGLLSAEAPGARFTTAWKLGKWDGVTRLMRGRFFPSGLVSRVVEHLAQFSTDVSVHDSATFTPSERFGAKLLHVESLRAYQEQGADVAARERRVFLELPTSGGKTVIGAEVIRRFGGVTLWLTHTSGLAKQTRTELAKFLGLAVGRVAGKDFEPQAVTVGMVQTLAKRVADRDPEVLRYLASVDVLVLDEAHHGGADTWVRVVEACVNVSAQVGLTATPPASSDPLRALRVEGVTGPKRVVAEISDLAEQGFLARPTVRLLEPPRDSYPSYEEVREEVLPSWRRDPRPLQKLGTKLFDTARRRGVVDNAARHDLIAAAALRHYRGDERPGGERVLILTGLHEHARAVALACRRAGMDRVWYPVEEQERERALGLFRTLDPPGILVATPWFREGMNVPEIDVGFIVGADLSETAIIQQFGRLLRVRPDKQSVLVYTVLDGRDPTDAKDYLAQHTLAQLRVFREKGWNVERYAPPG